jgi:hypothetical protein
LEYHIHQLGLGSRILQSLIRKFLELFRVLDHVRNGFVVIFDRRSQLVVREALPGNVVGVRMMLVVNPGLVQDVEPVCSLRPLGRLLDLL